MSVGSTGSQARLIQSSHPPAHYQPVLMKDLGKTQSPKQDLNVVELFSATGSDSSGSVVGGDSSDGDSVIHGRGCDAAEQQYTDIVMDKHLCALEDRGSLTSKTNTCDIAKYMANLKHMESEQLDISYECNNTTSNIIDTNQEVVIIDYNNSNEFNNTDLNTDTNVKQKQQQKQQQQEQSDEHSSSGSSGSCSVVKVDSKVDKVFNKSKQSKSDHQQTMKTSQTQTQYSKNEQSTKHTLRSPSTSSIHLSSHSPDRSRSTGTSPVRIIKIKSPRNSVSGDGGGKRLSVSSSRDSSKDRSPDRREISPRRASEGGILKRSLSPKPQDIYIAPSSSSCSSSTSSMGILKRSQSPIFKSRSPDRTSCMRKSLSPGNSIDSRGSPRGSIDSRSPDRHRLHIQDSCYSPHGGSFESRTSEQNLDIPRSVLKTSRSGSQGSFDSRSPDRSQQQQQQQQRKRSLSAHSSLEKSKSPEPYYHHYYQFYQQQQQQQQLQQQHSPDPKQRLSKSLERTSSKDSASSYRYGLSPERIYRIGPPVRSQSAENDYLKQYDVARSNESLTKSIEHPTCVECLYQRKPS